MRVSAAGENLTRAKFARTLGGEAAGRPAAAEIVCERDPRTFQRAFANAAAGRGPVFFANPDWGERERTQFEELTRQVPPAWDAEVGWLMIPTGGSAGAIKLARHDQTSLAAAVAGYRAFWQVDRVNALGVLPMHHVGGLLAWLRCGLSGGLYQEGNWREITAGGLPELATDDMSISLVPTQLQVLLNNPNAVAWLRQFSAVIMGGAALSETLKAGAVGQGIRLAPSYGMTETAAMVCAVNPVDLAQAPTGSVGRSLPHMQIKPMAEGEIGLKGASLYRGYWPETRSRGDFWATGDFGRLDASGQLTVVGRIDNLIISGGEKINPQEVEAVLTRLLGQDRIAIVGAADERWGEAVVLCHAREVSVDLAQLRVALAGKLAAYKWPKAVIRVDSWPVNAMGKLDRAALRAVVSARGRSVDPMREGGGQV